MAVSSVFKTALGCVSLGVVALTLTGCGSNNFGASPSKELGAFGGAAFGGPSPVVGATVTLYATSAVGYGTAGTPLGSTTTDGNGSYNFAQGALAACPAGTQAYVTASGGNPGSGLNPNYLLMAAIGPCSSISSTTFVKITEATTVAAAYALRPFTAVTNGTFVQISAPANNNQATGTCTVANGQTTSCVAAGLPHAFLNAANIVNAVGTFAAPPTGTFYQTVPTANANGAGIIPTAMLNSLANAVEACVNSTGGAAGDNTPCGNLFTYTTPPVTGAAAPANTLQAMLNVAQYPALAPTNVANLYNMSPATSFYVPALTSAPTDFSLAIAYPAQAQPVPPAGAVTGVTLTNNDTATVSSGTPASGVGYTSVASAVPTFSAPPAGGTQATGTAVLGVTYFSVASTFPACPDQKNTTQAVVVGQGSAGTGGAVNLSFDANGLAITPATVVATGTYTSLPSFTITCTNNTVAVSQGAATLKLKGLGVIGVTITNGGAGYTSAPTVTFPPPNATAAGSPPAAALITAAGTANYTAAGTSAPLAAPYAISLDANDNVYVANQNVSGATAQNSFVTGMTSNGGLLYNSTPSTTYTLPRGAMTDTLGHLWFSSNDGTNVVELNTVDGSFVANYTTAAAPFGIAIDRSNNVWYGVPKGSLSQNLYELQQSAAYASFNFAANGGIVPLFTNAIRAIAFGPNQNVHVNGYAAGANSIGGYGNYGTATTPAYGTAGAITQTLNGSAGPGIALDSTSTSWSTTSSGLYSVAPIFSANSVNSQPTTLTGYAPAVQASGAANLAYDEVDGVGNVWVGTGQVNGAAGQTVVQYIPSTSTTNAFAPCYAPAGATTCASVNLSQPQRVQVDSTGSVWITSVLNGRVYQLLGAGSPTWPQLSLGAPGVEPQ